MKMIKAQESITSDCSRVIMRLRLYGGKDYIKRIADFVSSLSETECVDIYREYESSFKHRHRLFAENILRNSKLVEVKLENFAKLSSERTRLLGLLSTMEYSFEAAALFNPSIIVHPDQSGVSDNKLKIILSLRATGEGHISSLTFREGLISADGTISLIKREKFAELPQTLMKISNTDYKLVFRANSLLSERVIFPEVQDECKGIEDFRFVKFTDDNGEEEYLASYTGYDGHHIKSKIIQTKDFISFTSKALKGKFSNNKGMALFPRKINGKYAMISRADGESLFINYSDDLYSWETGEKIAGPKFIWEQAKIGNCGSPMETPDGWLLLTHGVGPLRKYCIGAMLLDLNDPSKVLKRSEKPLLSPDEKEREGYVPNVVYTCGAIIHNGYLVIPYAASDLYTNFAKIEIDQLLKELSSAQ
ncbi:MAG: glycoside hydrolase family 130 protein [Bacteriovoracaceae bacterium]|nr:glycoside hydrolase family 130 protein [Bacteriovoracaceae bacterium]